MAVVEAIDTNDDCLPWLEAICENSRMLHSEHGAIDTPDLVV
jgi:hypothetical protein